MVVNNKTSFLLYKNIIHGVKSLTDDEAGKLYKSILNFVNGEPVTISSDLYLEIANQIELEWQKFNPKIGKYQPNYKGGITSINHAIRQSTAYIYWRKEVLKRDNYTCQDCGKQGGFLQAHHIKHFALFPELRTELSNGITLCKTCHKKAHKKEVCNG